MGSEPAEGHCQPGTGFLTVPTKRRSAGGSCTGMHSAADGGDGGGNKPQARSSPPQARSSPGPAECACCHVSGDCNMPCSHPASKERPAAAPGPAACPEKGRSRSSQHVEREEGKAVQLTAGPVSQQLLMRTSSSGPVTTRIHAAAICCPMESRLIHNILDSVPGVLAVDVMVVTKMVAVHHDPAAISPAALVAALNSAGLQASLNKHSSSGGGAEPHATPAKGSTCSSGCCSSLADPCSRPWLQKGHQQQQRSLWRRIVALSKDHTLPPLCVLVASLLLLINLLLLMPSIPAPSLVKKGLLALVAAGVAVPPVLKKAWMGLKNRNLDMNSLVVVALFGAIGLGDFVEAGALVVLFTVAEWLEEGCVQRAAGAMEDILKLQPEEALVILPDAASQPEAPQLGKLQQQHQQEPAGCAQHKHVGCCGPASGNSCPQGPNAQQPPQLNGTNNVQQQRHGHTHGHQREHDDHHDHHHHHIHHKHGAGGSCCAGEHVVVAASCSAGSSPCCLDGLQAHDAACHDSSHGHSCCTHTSHAHHGQQAAPKGAEAGSGSTCCSGHALGDECCPPSSAPAPEHQHQQHHHGCCREHEPQQEQLHEHHIHVHSGDSHQHEQEQEQEQEHQQGHKLEQHHHHDGCCHLHGHHHKHQCDHSHSHGHGATPQQGPRLETVPVAQLPVGVLVLVRPGDKVPVDGTIEAGVSVLDESMITGEAKPVTKSPGDAVLAGTINSGSVALRVRATAAAADSTVARLGALMEAAAASKSRNDMAVELFARYYTPAIVLTALLVAAVGSAVQPAAWRHWTYLSLVVLVTGCPCALVISTPVATVAGLTRAAHKGVLIKGGRPLELLGNLTAVSFDKSGTLTEGNFQLIKVHTFGDFSKPQVLQLAALLEQHSNHPIAHAIVGAAAAGGCMSSGGAAGAGDVIEVAGKGLHGHLDGRPIAVGSWNYAQELMVAAPRAANTCSTTAGQDSDAAGQGAGQQPSQQQQAAVLAEAKHMLSSADTAGCTVVCLVVDHQLAALLLLSDRARLDALAAVQQLQQLGVTCLMMTGDTMGAAAHIAGQLGIELDDVCAELLPQEKLELITTLRLRLAVARQRKQQQHVETGRNGPRQWLTNWRNRRKGVSSSSSNSGSGYCSSCGEQVGDCSCCVVLGPESSSGGMRRSSSGGLKGSSSSGVRIDATAGLAHAASSGGRRVNKTGVVIAHVGDGINDAPALAGADVGVAMGVAGAALAVDAADVALFSNNLTSLPFVVRLGRRAGWVVAANTVFACSIKLAVLGAAAGGSASLWLSLLADVGSSLLVTLHALTLLRFEAGADRSSAADSVLYGSRLSGIPLVGEPESQGGTGASQPAAARGAGGRGLATSASVSWLGQPVARLPGSSWLRGYDQLSDHTPAVSAGVSRLNSSTVRSSFLLGGAASGPSLTPKGSAAQELREMAILACAHTQDTARLLSPQAVGDGDEPLSGSSAGMGGVGSGARPAPGALFVIDDECC